jgi:hypothetical protein
MTILEYLQAHGDEYRDYLTRLGLTYGKGVIETGMLRFGEGAASWGGPFPGDYAFFKLTDYTGTDLPRRNDDYYRKSADRARRSIYRDTPGKKRKARHSAPTGIHAVTSATPVCLYLCGNDDVSYSKFYATVKEAQEDLALLKASEPVDFDDLADLGFVFTN